MTEIAESSKRIQILDRPTLSPGSCIVCGATGNDRRYINFDHYIDYYGTVYFCEICFGEISSALGWLPPHVAESLRLDVQYLQEDKVGASAEIGRLLVRIEALNEVLRSSVPSNVDTHRDVSDSEDVSQSPEGNSTEAVSEGTVSDGNSGVEGSERPNNDSSSKRSSRSGATKALKF